MKRVLLVFLIIVCLTTGVLMFANSAFAQAVIAVAQLNGTVRDTSGSVVANAGVSLRNLDTNRTYTSSSDASGYYIVPNLPPGSYELNATYAGFEPYVQSGIQLRVGQTAYTYRDYVAKPTALTELNGPAIGDRAPGIDFEQ